MIDRESYDVYVDEAGDRGWGGASSPVFVVSAVIVRRAEDRTLRNALDEINQTLGRPAGQSLHWAQNLREHSDRKMVAGRVGQLPVTVISVVLCKDSLMGSGTALSDPTVQYNYLLRMLLERISWFMDQQRPRGRATVRLAHIRRFKYDRLHDYLDLLRDQTTNISWDGLRMPPKIESPQEIRGLQVADLIAGCVYAAVRTDRHGDHEPTYLMRVAPRLWTGRTGKLTSYGLKFCGAPGCYDSYTWLDGVRRAAGE